MLHSNDPFKRGLKRGVSYHHGGLDNKKRSVVEMLFREKYLQVKKKTLMLLTIILVNPFSGFITYRAKLLNADWFRQRAFFLNFPSMEGKIT